MCLLNAYSKVTAQSYAVLMPWGRQACTVFNMATESSAPLSNMLQVLIRVLPSFKNSFCSISEGSQADHQIFFSKYSWQFCILPRLCYVRPKCLLFHPSKCILPFFIYSAVKYLTATTNKCLSRFLCVIILVL